MSYAETFRKLQPEYDPRHIEAYVRLQYGTLDHLSFNAMRKEARFAAECVRLGGVEAAERLAESYGLSDKQPIVRFGEDGQRVEYADMADASEHRLRMMEGLA